LLRFAERAKLRDLLATIRGLQESADVNEAH